jgi:hypothetical protein
MSWAGHVERMEAMRNIYRIFWLENLKGRYYWEDLGVADKIILEWMLRK